MKIQRWGGLAECLALGPRCSPQPVCWQEEERMSQEKEGGLAKHVFKGRQYVLGEGGRHFAGWSEDSRISLTFRNTLGPGFLAAMQMQSWFPRLKEFYTSL